MFGFIEQWLADILHLEYEPFTLNNGGRAAMLAKNTYIKVLQALYQVWKNSGDEECLCAIDKESDIHGMRVIVHKYYKDDNVLDGLTTGQMKETNIYAAIMEQGIGTQRFDERQFVVDIVRAMDRVRRNLDTEDPEEIEEVVLPEPTPIAPIENNVAVEEDITDGASVAPKKTKPKPKVPEKKKDVDTEEISVLSIIESLDDFFGWNFISLKNGYKVYSVSGNNILKASSLTLLSISNQFKKNIIVIDDCRPLSQLKNKNKFDQKILEKYFLIILIYPQNNPDFSLTSVGFRSIAYGKEIRELHVVRGVDVNKEIDKIKQSELEKSKEESEIQNILKDSKNSPYAKYDKIYKDTITNVVVAVQDKYIIHLLFPPSSQNDTITTIIFDEIIRRYDNLISYDELRKIDLNYLNSITEQNRDEYVKFAVDNSNSIIKSLKQKFEEAESQYKQYLGQALEFGKMSEKYMEQIDSFDEKSHIEKMKQKAFEEFTAVTEIEQIESVIVKEESVHVYTKNIYARDERTKILHDIGTFHIKIGMHSNNYDTQNTVIIRNTKHQIKAYNEQVMQAPHVFAEGYICHGTLATGMANAYKKRDLYQLVLQLVLFLGQANTDDAAGKFISRWPIVDESILIKKDGKKENSQEAIEAVEAVEFPAADKYDEVFSQAITL